HTENAVRSSGTGQRERSGFPSPRVSHPVDRLQYTLDRRSSHGHCLRSSTTDSLPLFPPCGQSRLSHADRHHPADGDDVPCPHRSAARGPAWLDVESEIVPLLLDWHTILPNV